jgi:hypothetical protein
VWTNRSTDGKGNVMRAKSDGRNPKELAFDAGRGVVMDRETVYFGGPRGGVFAVPRSGGRTRTLVEPGPSGSSSLALDGAWLVFTRQDGVSRVDTRSGRVEKLADGIPIPLGVAARDGVVYVAVNAVANRGQTSPAAMARLRIGDGQVQTDWLWSRAGARAGPIAVTATDAFMVSRPGTGTGAETLHRVSLAP